MVCGSFTAAQGLGCLVECGILVPRPGIEPMSFALEGRFLTSGPSEKPLFSPAFLCYYYFVFGWAWTFVAVSGLPLAGEWELLLASCCGGFSCRGAQAPWARASVVGNMGLAALWHVGSSWTRDQTPVP